MTGRAEVVGIVADVPYASVDTAPSPDVYLPLGQRPVARMVLLVESAETPLEAPGWDHLRV